MSIAEPRLDGPVRRRTAGTAMDSGRAGRRPARHRRFRMARPRRCRQHDGLVKYGRLLHPGQVSPPTSSSPRSGGRTGCGRCCAASSVGCGRTWTTSPRWRSGCRDDPHKRCRACTGVAAPVRARQRLRGCLRAPPHGRMRRVTLPQSPLFGDVADVASGWPTRATSRRRHRHHGVPGRPARQAAARRGPGRDRQDRAGQGGRRGDRRRADPAAVLRGARRGPRALRVELQEAAAAHPGLRQGRDLEPRPTTTSSARSSCSPGRC